nr:fimbrillin family protein [Elizabethkingia sp. ASV34]
MKHRYSQINVTLNTEAVGAASAISANVTPHQENNSFNLSDGTITYDTTAKEIPITFSGLNSTTLTGPVVISSPAITNGQFTISSITVGGVTKNNLTFKGLSITPGVKYNLNLTITAGFEIKNIEAGLYHSILLTKSGGIYVAGIGTNGQLGLNSNGIIYNTFQKVTTNIENIVPKSVDAGFEQSYIVTESGDLYATGRNDYGQLGLGDTKKRNVFTYVPFGGGSIKKFYVGVVHNFFLTHSGELYGFGANDSGQLGLGDRKNRHIPTKIPFFNDKPIKKIVSGERHSLVLTESGEVYTAGHNDYGQMGNITSVGGFKTSWVKIPLNEAVIKDIGAGTLTSHVLTESGELYGAGNNNFGQLGIGNNSNKSDFTLITNVPASIDEVVEFRDHTVLVTASGELYATGRNDYGQLGLGDTSNRNVFTHVSLTFPVKEVHPAASFNTFIKSASGMFYATGDNDRGHLGLGDNNNRKVFTPLTMN